MHCTVYTTGEMQSTVILSSALLLAFLAAPVLSLSVPTAKRSANELQLISKIPDQPVDSELAKRDINPGEYSSLCYLSPKHVINVCQFSSDNCVDWLYIMAFTSGVTNADVVDTASHNVSIKLKTGESRSSVLPNLPGDDYQLNKGDLWKLNLRTHFLFRDDCIQFSEIESIAIEQNDNDGWNIASIATFYRDDHYAGSAFQIATLDMDVNRWIDGNGAHSYSSLRFELSLVN